MVSSIFVPGTNQNVKITNEIRQVDHQTWKTKNVTAEISSELWKKIITVNTHGKSSWVIGLTWIPSLNSNKMCWVWFLTKNNPEWYRTTHIVNFQKFQEIIELENNIGTKLHNENLI